MTVTEQSPYDKAVHATRLTGRERGRHDASCIASLLGGMGIPGEIKYKIYNLETDFEAHDAFREALELPLADFSQIEMNEQRIEKLGFNDRLTRQLVVQDVGNIVCYIAQMGM